MRLISAGSLVRAQSGPLHFQLSISEFRFNALPFFSTRICNAAVCTDRALEAPLKTESKRKARGRSRENSSSAEKCADVCRDLNTRRLRSRETINELAAFLRDSQGHNENEHDRAGREQKPPGYMVGAEQCT